jgi:hypothetical protein
VGEAAVASDITEALVELGFGKPETGPTPERIRARAAEIAREQGYDLKDEIPPDVWIDAIKIALGELSPEEVALLASRAGLTEGEAPELPNEREQALAEIRDGIAELRNHRVTGVWGNRSVQGTEPPEREGVIYETPELRRTAAEFTTVSGGRVIIGPDEEGLRRHVEAEKRLRAEGKVGDFGTLVYTTKDYVRVIEDILKEEEYAAKDAATS